MIFERPLDSPSKLPSVVKLENFAMSAFDLNPSFHNKIHVILNHLFCFVVHRVEDHDDLTPIFNRQSDVLTSTYGMQY